MIGFISKPDYKLSPYTGITRKHWIEAAEYLLSGIFSNINDLSCPILAKRTETQITYPHLNLSKEANEQEIKAEIFEGLARSFFIAAPLIKDNPKATVCGISLKEYYKSHILKACDENDALYVGNYQYIKELAHATESSIFQQTVETAALVIGLWISEKEIWSTYTKKEQDIIADFIGSFAHSRTNLNNWRFFNMLTMAFLDMHGYDIDKSIMAEHAQAVLNYYVGDGWYRDGHNFDYYSCWAFNLYAPIWNLWYGYENEPEIAKQLELNSNKLMETYADFFDEDGFTNMWGRSGIYRNASTSAFVGNLFLNESKMNCGLARRIMSGSLLQFIKRKDFLANGFPSLGFYGQFTPMLQPYSCAESPLWIGKAFLCLYFSESHPFWNATENNGTWEALQSKELKETFLGGPALCFSNHKANGETVLRSAKITLSDLSAYAKLCYNTKYPWESTPIGVSNIESQQYVIDEIYAKRQLRANVTYLARKTDDVFYRRQIFQYELKSQMSFSHIIDLADFPVAYGIIRVDKPRLLDLSLRLTLGAYGFPDNGTEIIHKSDGDAKAIILKGKDFVGREKQLAMTVYGGWHKIDFIRSCGTNPDSERSIIVYAEKENDARYDGYATHLLISQVITKESHADFSDEEIFPIKEVKYSDRHKTGTYGTTTLIMKNGTSHNICFDNIESCLQV